MEDVGFPHSSVGKESAYSAGDPSSIPGLGRSPGEGMTIHSSILAWKIPWMEEPGRLQFTESRRDMTATKPLNHHHLYQLRHQGSP